MRQPEFETYMGNCFKDLEESLNALNQKKGAYQIAKRAKVLLKVARFADKILRRLEDNPGAEGEQIRAALDSLGKDRVAMAKLAVEASLDALNMGSVAATDFIPRLLDIVGQYRNEVGAIFQQKSQETPSWVFLRWISQITSIVNRPESPLFQPLV